MTTRLEHENYTVSTKTSTVVSRQILSKATHCCYCTLELKFDSLRIGCPINRTATCVTNGKHFNISGTSSYDTVGVFCSFSCAKAFARANMADPSFLSSETLLAKMYAQEYNFSGPITITPSPSPLLLSKFGGPMSEEQYANEKGRVHYEPNGRITYNTMTNIFTKIE